MIFAAQPSSPPPAAPLSCARLSAWRASSPTNPPDHRCHPLATSGRPARATPVALPQPERVRPHRVRRSSTTQALCDAGFGAVSDDHQGGSAVLKPRRNAPGPFSPAARSPPSISTAETHAKTNRTPTNRQLNKCLPRASGGGPASRSQACRSRSLPRASGGGPSALRSSSSTTAARGASSETAGVCRSSSTHNPALRGLQPPQTLCRTGFAAVNDDHQGGWWS